MNIEIEWIDRNILVALHEQSLLDHGGLPGWRDEGLLDSALARPQQILNYEPDATLARIAAAYAVGISRNHPFADGNKRAAFLAMTLFCRVNGWHITAPEPEIIALIFTLAAGELDEEQLTAWIGTHLEPFASRQL